MKLKHETRTFTLEAITPLHIGDGNILKNWDVVTNGSRVSVYDINEVIEAVQNDPKALELFGQEGSDLKNFLKDKKDVKPAYSMAAVLYSPKPRDPGSKPQPVSVTELRTIMKNGFGKPYVPGSSIKGAIRTPLWVSLDRKNLPPSTDKNFEFSVKKIQGTPHDDFLKPLIVSDSGPIDISTLMVQEVKVKSLRLSGPPTLKQSIFVEAFPPKTRLSFSMGLNELSTGDMEMFKIKPCQSVTSWDAMVKQINSHHKTIAERERDFFNANHMQDTAEFYSALINRFDTLPEGAFIFRMSWGSGWRGMTGDWIFDDKNLMAVRKKHTLGKTYYECPDCKDKFVKFDKKEQMYVCQNKLCGKKHKYLEKKFVDIFPKSRRLALENGSFKLPMGWVMAMPGDGAQIDETGMMEPPLPDNIIVNRQTETERLEEKINSFRQKVNASKNISGDIGIFTSIIKDKNNTDQVTKTEMCQILLEKAIAGDKKKFRKSLKEGKTWAVSIINLCKENQVDTGALE